MTTVPETEAYRKYVTKGPLGPKVTIHLAGKKQVLSASEPYLVVLPVLGTDGTTVYIEEICSFSDCRLPLYGAMHRDTALRNNSGGKEEVEVTIVGGKLGWAHVNRTDTGKPVIKILTHLPPYGHVLRGYNAEARETEKEGKLKARGDEHLKEERDLLEHHRRFAHAKGQRLYATLKEYGLLGSCTLKQCLDVECITCNLLNMRKCKIPRAADTAKEHLVVGELTLQDLTEMPVAFDGSRHLSVIVDARSRFISLQALRRKDQALQHSVAYIGKLRELKHGLVNWHTGNGGEFIGDDYEKTIVSMGIHHQYGAPHTPESQGIVERANGTIKRLLGKVLRDLKLPVKCWPAARSPRPSGAR